MSAPFKMKGWSPFTQKIEAEKKKLKEEVARVVDEEIKKQEKILDQKYRLGGYKGGQIGRKI